MSVMSCTDRLTIHLSALNGNGITGEMSHVLL